MGDDLDISALTIEQYLDLIQDNNRPGIVKPKIGDDVEFEINSNFMRELRSKLFAGTDDEDAYEHVQRKVQIFYTGLDISSRRMLDSRGIIPLMTLTQALKSIQVMSNHSHNWYDETIIRKKINNRPNNVDAIQGSFKGAHLTKEYTLKKEDKVKKSRQELGKESVKEPDPHDLPVFQTYAPPMPFLGHLKVQIGSPYRTQETVCAIGILEEIHENKAQGDKRDMKDGWDITIKDVERLRQFLTPTIHTLPNLKPVIQPYIPVVPVQDEKKVIKEEEHDYDDVMQPLTPYTFHTTSPNDGYVAPATNPILDK
uniref:Uncharacterized protein n=1 Tax=Tanacetum cinerariifolium TaxID=118510 RepID=A0A699H4E0_TANCI|nr:hypothetical protein [Tanacetum cinerariifolium]